MERQGMWHGRFGLLILVLGALACNLPAALDSQDRVGGREMISASVSTDGADIAGPNGLRLIVPEGALENEVEIHVQEAGVAPAPPAGATPHGAAYEVTLPPNTELRFPIEVVLPVEDAAAGPQQPAAFRWDGADWDYLGGIVEDDGLHVNVSSFSTLQALFLNLHQKPILFLNRSGNKAFIFAWTWETEESYRLNQAYAFTNRYGILGEEASWAVQNYPVGTYSSWCVQWDDFTEPVWDLGGGGFWSEYLGTYHQFINETIVLDPQTPGGDYIDMVRLDFALADPIPGVCGETPPGGRLPEPTEAPAAARPAPSQSFPVQIGNSTVTVSLFGGYALEWENPPENFAVANLEDRPPPDGVTIAYGEGTTGWGIGRILWSTGDWVAATTSLDVAAIGAQVHGDETIGWVRFLFDGVEVWSGDSKSLWNSGVRYGVYIEVSGFEPGSHTLRAEAAKGVQDEGGGSVPVGYFTFIPH